VTAREVAKAPLARTPQNAVRTRIGGDLASGRASNGVAPVDDFGLYTVTARPERGVDSFAGECPKNRTGEDPQ
jgi:hypothetical protein